MKYEEKRNLKHAFTSIVINQLIRSIIRSHSPSIQNQIRITTSKIEVNMSI